MAALQLFNSSPRVSMLLSTVTSLLSLVTDSTEHIVTEGSKILVCSTSFKKRKEMVSVMTVANPVVRFIHIYNL